MATSLSAAMECTVSQGVKGVLVPIMEACGVPCMLPELLEIQKLEFNVWVFVRVRLPGYDRVDDSQSHGYAEKFCERPERNDEHSNEGGQGEGRAFSGVCSAYDSRSD
jgi:hypothetical protein